MNDYDINNNRQNWYIDGILYLEHRPIAAIWLIKANNHYLCMKINNQMIVPIDNAILHNFEQMMVFGKPAYTCDIKATASKLITRMLIFDSAVLKNISVDFTNDSANVMIIKCEIPNIVLCNKPHLLKFMAADETVLIKNTVSIIFWPKS